MSSLQKITDLIRNSSQKRTFSFEITPAVTPETLSDITMEPLFYAVTWHAKTHQCKDYDIAPLKLAKLLSWKRKNVLLHVSCDMMRKEYLDQLLLVLQEHNICNLFVVLGEKFESTTSDFINSKEMIAYIREKTKDYFCIGVAGYPEYTYENLSLLKDKIDVGADFIITQAFFEEVIFNKYVQACKNIGITIPIIPGIFLFDTYQQLSNFVNLCKVKVPNVVLEKLKHEQVTGSEITSKLIDGISSFNTHCHLFTLNKLNYVIEFIASLE